MAPKPAPKRLRVIVKIGTNLIAKPSGELDHEYIAKVAKAVAEASKTHDVILWSSGAVAAGREALSEPKQAGESVAHRRMLASVGQSDLVSAYKTALRKHGLEGQQLVVTGDHLRSRKHRALLRETVDEALSHQGKKIIPIGNVNDALTNEEFRQLELGAAYYALKNAAKEKGPLLSRAKSFLKSLRIFPDNDRAVSRVAKQLGASHVIILSNVEGLMDKPPEQGGRVIERVPYSRFGVKGKKLELGGAQAGSLGGMLEKYLSAKRMARQGVAVSIAHGGNPGAINEILSEKQIGTLFKPNPKRKPAR